jgi:hypothetical protein
MSILGSSMAARSALIAACALLASCQGTFKETHYFSSVEPISGKAVNFFRLTVRGRTEFTSARYISGYYDERAIDLFLNEAKSQPLAAGDGLSSIFKYLDCVDPGDAACRTKQEERLRLVPLGGAVPKNGAFVMILSTNADAIAGTIGSLAENEILLNSTLFLLNRGTITSAAQAAAVQPIADARRSGTIAGLDALYADADGLTTTETEGVYLQILRTIAGELGGTPPVFATDVEARTWFAANRPAKNQ